MGILAVHTRKVPIHNVDLEVLARGTPGFSGADLEFLVNEAALIAARRDKDKVEMEDFEEAKDKVLMGAERRSMFISDKEKRTTAVHEAGHALVARFVDVIGGDSVDPVHKVTIIPRGRALGVTQQLPPEDRLSMTREFAQNQIAILMGGRVAAIRSRDVEECREPLRACPDLRERARLGVNVPARARARNVATDAARLARRIACGLHPHSANHGSQTGHGHGRLCLVNVPEQKGTRPQVATRRLVGIVSMLTIVVAVGERHQLRGWLRQRHLASDA